VRVDPVSPERLALGVADLVLARAGRVRVILDGPAPTRPGLLADRVAVELRARGRAAVVVDAGDFLRPASVRLEYGREDPDELLDGWLDVAGLRREVLDRAGSGQVLPRLWDAAADRAFRDGYAPLPEDGVVLLHGALLLGRGLPAELTVHLRMGAAALERNGEPRWTLPAHARHDRERVGEVDLMVLADHPDRPAVTSGWGGRSDGARRSQ
jgi:hypothetical protein